LILFQFFYFGIDADIDWLLGVGLFRLGGNHLIFSNYKKAYGT
jgi:hypothetical protein